MMLKIIKYLIAFKETKYQRVYRLKSYYPEDYVKTLNQNRNEKFN